jgi:hypothetical protein
VFETARVAEDAARTEFHRLEKVRKTSPDPVAVARARLAAVAAETAWVEAHANREAAERDRDAGRTRVIERRRPAVELEYAKRLKQLDEALQVAVEKNAACVEVWEQGGQAGVRLDVLHWAELSHGNRHIWSRWDAWRAALSKFNWFA